MIAYVPLGTLLHESGHILIAHMLHYKTTLHYASMDWYSCVGEPGTDLKDNFYINLGGVILLDSISIAFLLLLLFAKRLAVWLYWMAVFSAMLIYRHILLTFIGLTFMLSGKPMSYGRDEREMADYLHICRSVIGIPLFVLALLSAYVLYFKVLDRDTGRTLFIATVVGCPIGYILWLYVLGPVWMP
jgi:hypothetical protein